MNIAAFNGSPRINGNTELLLNAAIKGIKEKGHDVRTYNLNIMNIKPCQDCGGCDKTGRCTIQDDMEQVYGTIREADRIILASPIFFSGLSAQAKIMIDRCQSFWCEKYLLKKPIPESQYGKKGLLLLVGGMKKVVGVQCAEATVKAFFRTVSIQRHEAMSFLGIDAKGAMLEHPDAIEQAYLAGERLVSPSAN